MTETELIQKIKELREIKPRKDWVLLAKTQILGSEPNIGLRSIFPPLFRYRPALVTLLVFFILIGVFGFAQNTVPGDLLYPVKKIVETSEVIFSSEMEKPKIRLELANRRLRELNWIAEKNLVKNLAPAIEEFQSSVTEAAKGLTKIRDSEINPKIVKEVAKLAQELEENKEKVEALGVVVGETEELDNALAQLVEREINILESQSLTEAQQELLVEIKNLYQAGEYSEALEKILILSNY